MSFNIFSKKLVAATTNQYGRPIS